MDPLERLLASVEVACDSRDGGAWFPCRDLKVATREALSGEAAFCGVLRSCFWDRCSVSV